ncbi:MAG: class I SAM-dependent methyltransferase [Saprospiraceae bacterium]
MADNPKIDDFFASNKQLWNNKTEVHIKSDFYDNESFLKGRNTLNPIELEYLKDIKDKTILHIQCHFGQDSISLARMGAKVTATDISNVALQYANEFNKTLNTDVKFVETDTYRINEYIDEKFDLVLLSYGAIPWLPDINKLAEIVKSRLNPGGRVLIVEFHPMFFSFDHDSGAISFGYNNVHMYAEDVEGTYADKNSSVKGKEYFWQHSLEEIMMPFINNKMKLNVFREYYYSPYNAVSNMKQIDDNKYVYGDFPYPIPHVFLMEFINN